ncbi:MAG TPA: YdbL family protein [Alphaproteobacteria bacterium]|nr:YdbL family protein [Alphaproteobacteria bacterium]
MTAATVVTMVSLTPRLAAAQTLDQAKASGLVGEMPNGYVGAVQAGGSVRALVDSVNAQRRERYQEVAASNGVPLAVVEQRAGTQLIERTPRGQFVMNASGQWVRK